MDFDFSFQKLWFDGKIQKGNSTIYCWEQFHSFNDDAILQPKLGNFSQCQGKNAQGQAGVVDMVLVFQLSLLISNAMRHLPIGKIELLLIKVRVLTKGWCDISCRINCKLFLKYPQYTNSLVVKFRWQLVAWESSECWWVSLSEEKTSFWLGKYVHNVSNDHWGGFGLFAAAASAESAIWLTAWAVARTFKHQLLIQIGNVSSTQVIYVWSFQNLQIPHCFLPAPTQ